MGTLSGVFYITCMWGDFHDAQILLLLTILLEIPYL